MGDADLAGLKAMLPAMLSVIEEARVNDLELVAEGDALTAEVPSRRSQLGATRMNDLLVRRTYMNSGQERARGRGLF